MIISMTGFSSLSVVLPAENSAKEEDKISVTMTLKSVNSRFFEANCKIPYMFAHLETECIKRFKSKLYRGNIYFVLHVTNLKALAKPVEPSPKLISYYIKSLSAIAEQFNIKNEVTLRDIMNLPDIFQMQEQSLDETHSAYLLKAVDELIEQLFEARKKEGAVLAQDLYARISTIRAYMLELQPRAQIVMAQKKEQLLQSLNAALLDQNQEAVADTQHLVINNQLDRIDINEEIVRFNMHLDMLYNCLESPAIEKGKKLDFTLQELFREINTVASKGSDGLLSNLAINIKVELEKAREQAQNIV